MTHTDRWTTSCDGCDTDTRPHELAALGEHLSQCSARHARLVALACGAQRFQGFVTARLVTMMALLAGLVGLGLLLF